MEVANQYLREPIAIIVAPNGARKLSTITPTYP